MNIAKTDDGINILYDINKIKKVGTGVVASVPKKGMGSHTLPTSINTVPQSDTDVNNNYMQDKTKHSLKDSEGNELTEQQQEKIVNMMNTALSEYQKNNTTENGSVKYSLTEDFDDQTDFTENIKSVVNMNSVCDMNGTEFAKGTTDLITQVSNYFDRLKNIIHSKYGDVIINRTGIKSSLGHGIGRNKAVAFTAVPNVIEQGKIINYHVNHKGRGYDTAAIAAPITIDKTPYYMAVIIIVEKDKNTYYLHEVALQKKKIQHRSRLGPLKIAALPAVLHPLFIVYSNNFKMSIEILCRIIH